MATTNSLVELSHYSYTLVSAHTHQDWVSEPMPEQLPIHKVVLGKVSLYLLALLGLKWEYPIRQVAPVGCHPCVPLLNRAHLHGIPQRNWVSPYTGRPQRLLSQRPVTPRPSPKRTDLINVLSATNVRCVLRVSCITVLCLPPLPELASLASRSARAFCSLGMCTSSNTANTLFKTWTYPRYATIYGSLAWYSPVT